MNKQRVIDEIDAIIDATIEKMIGLLINPDASEIINRLDAYINGLKAARHIVEKTEVTE